MTKSSMINSPVSGRFRLAATLACVFALAGCAISTPRGSTPEEEVKQRALARWNAVVAGDWQKAYGFATPAYRNAVDLSGFRSRSAAALTYKSAEVLSVTCEESACQVRMEIGFAPLQKGFPDLKTALDERWVAEAGEWWRYESF